MTLLALLALFVSSASAQECNGNGVVNATSSTCVCNDGYGGLQCETPICEKECLNDGICIGANQCQCPVGWDGDRCENVNVFGSPDIKTVLGYALVTIASWVMGNVAPQIGLPKITAYIGVGVIAGSYVLNIIPEDEIRNLDVIDKVSLAYIAFAAGSKPIVGGRSITTVTSCLVLFTFALVTLVMVLISPQLEFTKDLSAGQQGGVAILVGTLACARSPSSAIAIIDDLRAAGPFTVLTMAVTCVMDVLVIFMFAVNNLIASSQFDTGGDSTSIFGKSMARLILSTLFGMAMGKFIIPIMLWWWPKYIKKCKRTRYIFYAQVIILAGIGLLVFVLDHYDDDLLDALIIAMVAGYTISNHTIYSKEFHEILDGTATVMYVMFFTLVGASLGLDSFGNTFGISMLFFFVRIVSLMMGSFIGGWIADEPNHHNKIAWQAYVTQAGVALGLAKKIHGQFPEWGDEFATLIVAMVVLNQIVGPPLFKRALSVLGEAGRQPPRVRGKVIVLAQKKTDIVRTALRGLIKVGYTPKYVNTAEASDPKKGGFTEGAPNERICRYVTNIITDEVRVIILVLEDALAQEVAIQVYNDMPDCRVIVQQLPRDKDNEQKMLERPRSSSTSGALKGLPPGIIVLDPPENSLEQLLLAATLSAPALFPSIANALEEKKIWERNIASFPDLQSQLRIRTDDMKLATDSLKQDVKMDVRDEKLKVAELKTD
mmetsp:Transcript_12591/g.25647  ORF Transcript_12591/g.25647 Transcript_12591/m.25647 type:complete len:715 (-) Transcript_12591:464-2608(-)